MSFIWFYTAIDTFDQCPRKFYHKYILKEKDPETPALARGNAVHKALEHYMKYGYAKGDIDIGKFHPLADAVVRQARGKKLMVELKMGVLGNLEPCGFFDDHVYGRGAADVLIVDYPNAFLIDWKTGKVREKRTQLAVLSLFVFKHFPRVNIITACNIWLEAGHHGEVYTFERSGEAAGWLELISKVKQIEAAIERQQFCMMPGPLCGFCPVKQCPNNRS